MEKQKLSRSKVQGMPRATVGKDRYAVLVKVNKAGYIPAAVVPRERIDAYIFTADATDAIIKKLESDGNVVSVAINKALPLIR